MTRPGRIFIGTSGWHYGHWRGPFYPPGLRGGELLACYIRHFNTVEVNNSFYRLPEEKTLKDWRDSAGADFIFSMKASRLITHYKKLKDPESTLPPFLERVKILGAKLGPVLFQLPPGWRINLDRLREFLKALPGRGRYVFEFRNSTWFDPEVYALLKQHNAAFCIYDLDRTLSPRIVTSDFVYIRLHGPDGPYRGKYTDEALKGWARDITLWREGSRDVYCYFDNDEAGYAPVNARRLKEILKGL